MQDGPLELLELAAAAAAAAAAAPVTFVVTLVPAGFGNERPRIAAEPTSAAGFKTCAAGLGAAAGAITVLTQGWPPQVSLVTRTSVLFAGVKMSVESLVEFNIPTVSPSGP
jgi:hypothetical protein